MWAGGIAVAQSASERGVQWARRKAVLYVIPDSDPDYSQRASQASSYD